MSFTFAPYQNAYSCTYAQPGTKALAAYLEDRFPWQYYAGIYACRKVSGTTIMSEHAEGRAYDAGVPLKSPGVADAQRGMQIVNLLGSHGKRLGIELLIWNRRSWAATHPAGRYYSGVNPHIDHVHIGMNRYAGRYLNYTTLVSVLGPTSTPTPTPPPPTNITTETIMQQLPVLRRGDGFTARASLRVPVRRAQAMLAVAGVIAANTFNSQHQPDGLFGPGTEAAVKKFQLNNSMAASGLVDLATWAKLLGV